MSSIDAQLSEATPREATRMPYDPRKQREHIKDDLLMKFAREDWHGVADAAMDLRDIDAFIAGRAGAPHP